MYVSLLTLASKLTRQVFTLSESELLELLQRRNDNDSSSNDCDNSERIYVVDVKSYAISNTLNLLRHIYIVVDNIEIHAGMCEQRTRARRNQLMFCNNGYYGDGRSEGKIVMCTKCLDNLLSNMSRKSKTFHILYNNCDTITPMIMQTALLWLSIVCASICALLYYVSAQFDTFNVVLIAPLCGMIAMLFTNAIDGTDAREDDLLWVCDHL